MFTEDEQLDILSNQETCCVFRLRHLLREYVREKGKIVVYAKDPLCSIVYLLLVTKKKTSGLI